MAPRLNKVTFRATALKELESLPKPIQKLAAEVIESLRMSDMPKGAIVMRNRPDLRRIYVGAKHRLLYAIVGKHKIAVLRIRHRKLAYAHLDKIRLH